MSEDAAQGPDEAREAAEERDVEPHEAAPHLVSPDEPWTGVHADEPAGDHAVERLAELPDDAASESREHNEAGEIEGESVVASGRRDASDDADGARRRRRRGRRGGRRSREDSDAAMAAPEREVSPIEEELAHAVADFGGPPTEELARDMADIAAAHHAVPAGALMPAPPTAAPEATVPPTPARPEPSRRRSTVREPAPAAGSGSPTATPVLTQLLPASPDGVPPTSAPAQPASAEATPEPTAPRRAGWWAKRVLGERG